jgi:hypothetical protein
LGVNRKPQADSSPLVSKPVRRCYSERGGPNQQAAADFAAKEVIRMTILANKRSYNLADTFGESVETDSIRSHATSENSWCNQPDGIFEEDDAVREQGGAAKRPITNLKRKLS